MLPDGMGFEASQVSSKRKQKKKRIPNLITPMINALNYISSILNSEKKNIVNTIIGDFKSEIYPIQNNLIQTSIRINFIYQINKLTRRTATDLLLPPPSSLLPPLLIDRSIFFYALSSLYYLYTTTPFPFKDEIHSLPFS